MATKVGTLILILAFVGSASFAYYENSVAATLREENSRLRRELKKTQEEARAVRIEVAKLRSIIQNDEARIEQLLSKMKK
ncbi:MAG: hypothetical protein AB7K37_02920 [Cyclobacteriaceae bacterium]